jgi:hypothetical protein
MEKQKQKILAPTLKRFGLEWCLQGLFENPEELATVKKNWQKNGHRAMIINKNILYVTRFKQ